MKEIFDKWMGEMLVALFALTVVITIGIAGPHCNRLDQRARILRMRECAAACSEHGVWINDPGGATPVVCVCRP